MFRNRTFRHASIVGLVVLATACDTATAPDPTAELDTDQALADYEALDAVLTSSEFAGFQALGGRTPFGSGPAAVDAVTTLGGLAEPDEGRSFALQLVRRLLHVNQAGRPAAAPIISDVHRGAVFVYDPVTDGYTIDPDRTEGPDTGVRFVIYAVAEDGRPMVEEETGYADLVDEGDDSAEDIVLRLMVVQRDEKVLDYRTTLDENENRGALTVRGFLRGNGVQLDFDIEAVGTEGPEKTTLDVAFEIGVDARGFSITGNVRGVEEGVEGEGDIDLTVRHRSHSIRVDVRGEAGAFEGTVFLNGDIFATVTGVAGEEPVFLGQSGDPITLPEMLVLHRIFDTVEDVFDFLEDLLDPVDELVILGIIL